MAEKVTQKDLHSAFIAADNILLKKYINQLSQAHCIEISDEFKKMEIGDNVALYRVARIVYDKNENIQDKLTTVYSAVLSLDNCSLIMAINGQKDKTDLYLGVANRNLLAKLQDDNKGVEKLYANERALADNGRALKNTFIGNFPGTELQAVNNIKTDETEGKTEVIRNLFKNKHFISAVSSIPALRNANERKSIEFIQGLEKFIDSLRGKEYSAIIIADAVNNSKIEAICAQYEDIYSQLSPFKQSSETISATKGSSDTEGLVKGVVDTTNESVSKALSQSTSKAKTHTDTVGGSVSVGVSESGTAGVPGVASASVTVSASVSANYSHAYGRTKTETKGKTVTKSKGTSKSLTEQNSVSRALSKTEGKAVQVTYENRAVKTLLDRIDEQIKRMRSCEDFGMFDTCSYFMAKDYDTVVAAASAFKSITRGENSSVEASAVNIWKDSEDISFIKDYLMRFYHPEFVSPQLVEYIPKEKMCSVTPAMLVSGREMAYQMAMPKKSVAGIPVIECAEFGREIVSMDGDCKITLPLGNVYHMRNEDKLSEIKLNANNLTAHTFITGSTGSGKSTTIYKILAEAVKLRASKDKGRVSFMVVEPAKGEYKNIAKALGAKVYGTNPKLTPLLKINPFRFPADEIHIYEHMDKLTELFNVCWPMYAAMPAVLKASIENAYRSAGWNLIESTNKYGNIFPTFVDVAREVEKYINKSQYSDENKSNYKGSLLTRLESLTNGINGMIFSSDDIEDEALFDENVIVDLSRVGSTETKALIMGALVLKLQEYRISASKTANSELTHITVLEEAHNLLKRTSTEQSSESSNLLGKSVEMLANSIAEMRTYGEAFIIADQSPGLLDLSVIRNTNTKIIMRLPDYSDRELVGKAANLNDDQIAELAKLPKGVAAVYQSEWINPVLCKVAKPGNIEQEYPKSGNSPASAEDNSLVLDMLDSEFRNKLDDLHFEGSFKEKIFKSDIPTELKIRLLVYLKERKSSRSFDVLSSVVYDFFRNSKQTLEESLEDGFINDAQELRMHIIATLEPSVMDCSEEQIDMAIALIMKEYIQRYNVACPVWEELAVKIARGEFCDGKI